MTQTKHAIIIETLVTWFMHVLWKRAKWIIWLGFQKEPPLTTKDLRKYEYQKPHLDFICVEVKRIGEWFLDSTCLRYMIEDDQLFSSITKINGEKVTFRDNSKGKIIGGGNIGG